MKLSSKTTSFRFLFFLNCSEKVELLWSLFFNARKLWKISVKSRLSFGHYSFLIEFRKIFKRIPNGLRNPTSLHPQKDRRLPLSRQLMFFSPACITYQRFELNNSVILARREAVEFRGKKSKRRAEIDDSESVTCVVKIQEEFIARDYLLTKV